MLEVIECARRVTGVDIPAVTGERRPGDPAALVATPELAGRELGWIPESSDLDEIMRSAWEWKKKHPKGYRSPAGARQA